MISYDAASGEYLYRGFRSGGAVVNQRGKPKGAGWQLVQNAATVLVECKHASPSSQRLREAFDCSKNPPPAMDHGLLVASCCTSGSLRNARRRRNSPIGVQHEAVADKAGSRFPAAISLVVFALCVGAFLPPFLERTVSSVPLTIAAGLAIAVTFALHVAFVGIAAHRAHRSAILWSVTRSSPFPSGRSSGSSCSSGSAIKPAMAPPSTWPSSFERTLRARATVVSRPRILSAVLLVAMASVSNAAVDRSSCQVAPFQGATLPHGAVATMQVAAGSSCSIVNYGLPAEHGHPPDRARSRSSQCMARRSSRRRRSPTHRSPGMWEPTSSNTKLSLAAPATSRFASRFGSRSTSRLSEDVART